MALILRLLRHTDALQSQSKLMKSTHNPDRFMADLRQILSQGRKRIGFLVGAGAPMSIRVDANHKVDPTGKPLIPGINELTTAAVAGLTPEQEKAVGVARAMIGDSATIEKFCLRSASWNAR